MKIKPGTDRIVAGVRYKCIDGYQVQHKFNSDSPYAGCLPKFIDDGRLTAIIVCDDDAQWVQYDYHGDSPPGYGQNDDGTTQSFGYTFSSDDGTYGIGITGYCIDGRVDYVCFDHTDIDAILLDGQWLWLDDYTDLNQYDPSVKMVTADGKDCTYTIPLAQSPNNTTSKTALGKLFWAVVLVAFCGGPLWITLIGALIKN